MLCLTRRLYVYEAVVSPAMVQSSTVSRRPLCRGCIGWQRVCMGRTRLSWCSLTSDFIMSVRLCNTMSCQTDNRKSVNIFRSNAEIMLYCTIHYASNLVRLQAGGGYPLQQRSTYSILCCILLLMQKTRLATANRSGVSIRRGQTVGLEHNL